MEHVHQLSVLACLVAVCAIQFVLPAAVDGNKPKVILVSMDGFRHDYLSKVNTPNFDKMMREGVTMPYINNTFTTLTFPSHFTMVTGLYEETHGIVGNRMYDPTMKSEWFSMGTTESGWWSGHDTIWTTAQKAGLKAGVFLWVGSASVIEGTLPDKYFPFDGTIPFEDRVDALVRWMTIDDFDLGLLYFNEPDHKGHTNGPNGKATLEAVEMMDGILGRLMSKLDEAGIGETVNLIVTSDHGMAEVDSDTKIIELDHYLNETELIEEIVMSGPMSQIIPKPGKEREIIDALQGVEHMSAMLKEDIPERYHYKNNPRVAPVFLLADEGYTIWKNAYFRSTTLNYPRFLGDHGFDNELDSMKPIFVAKGPAFKKNTVVDPIKTVDIYPLICDLLRIDPAPNNGSLTRARTLMVEKSQNNNLTDLSTRTEVCSVLILSLLVLTTVVKRT